jgi:hypothetical protein
LLKEAVGKLGANDTSQKGCKQFFRRFGKNAQQRGTMDSVEKKGEHVSEHSAKCVQMLLSMNEEVREEVLKILSKSLNVEGH